MHLRSTRNVLQAIGEFIDDTEDYVNITLDSHRNQLIQIDLLLTAATFAVGLMTFIAGLFGMNLTSGLELEPHMFDAVSSITVAFAFVIVLAFVWLMRAEAARVCLRTLHQLQRVRRSAVSCVVVCVTGWKHISSWCLDALLLFYTSYAESGHVVRSHCAAKRSCHDQPRVRCVLLRCRLRACCPGSAQWS